MINIKGLPNPAIIRELYGRYYVRDDTPDGLVSSYWREQSRGIKVHVDNDGGLTSFRGCGFGDLGPTRLPNKLIKYCCDICYFIESRRKKDLLFITGKALPILRKIGSYLSDGCFRQMLSLCSIRKHLKIKEKKEFNILIIGDGYGFLSALAKGLYPGSKITLVDIGKVLLFQAVNLQRACPQYKHALPDRGGSDKGDFDFLYVPGEHIEEVKDIKYGLIINIASMQEMNYGTINGYFSFFRRNAARNNLFYCCNRESKVLPGGELIEFSKYPWHPEDRVMLDEECLFYKYYLYIKPPFMRRFDGTVRHRLVNLKTYEKNA